MTLVLWLALLATPAPVSSQLSVAVAFPADELDDDKVIPDPLRHYA